MATYKVPQDVEADDKLIGPFSFRQFIYLIAVVLAGIAAWGLAQIFIGLVILPLPIIVFFGALALPLRKDQPMEVYMAAMVSFYLKPRKRLWDPEGIETVIEITAPKTYEDNRTKNLTQGEAEQRLGYLASIVDTGGWAIRGTNAAPSVTMNNDIYVEAQSAVDVLDNNTSIAQSFNQMMAQSSTKVKDEAMERMKTTVFAPTVAPVIPQAPESVGMPEFNPYPTNIQQTVIQPLNDPSHMADLNIQPVEQPAYSPVETPEAKPVAQTSPAHSSTTTSETPIPADIIKLANNADGLSIETIAHEANRIHKKLEQAEEEVVISLR
jgi:hypothetical protein